MKDNNLHCCNTKNHFETLFTYKRRSSSISLYNSRIRNSFHRNSSCNILIFHLFTNNQACIPSHYDSFMGKCKNIECSCIRSLRNKRNCILSLGRCKTLTQDSNRCLFNYTGLTYQGVLVVGNSTAVIYNDSLWSCKTNIFYTLSLLEACCNRTLGRHTKLDCLSIILLLHRPLELICLAH